MLFENSGVLVVLQISSKYLEKVIRNQVNETFPACLPKVANNRPITTGGKVIRIENLIAKFKTPDFRYDGTDTFVQLTLERIDGSLEAGTSTSNLQPVNDVTLEYAIQLSRLPAQNNQSEQLLIELVLELPLVPNPSFVLPLGSLELGDVTLSLAQDVGRLKLISDGNLALGLNLNVASINLQADFTRFLSSYDESHLGPNSQRNWSLSVDERIIAAVVNAMDLSEGRNNLRSTHQHMAGLTSSGLTIKGGGEAKNKSFVADWWGFDFEARANFNVNNPGTDMGIITVDYRVTDVHAHSIIVADSKVMDGLKKKGQDKGSVTVMSPAHFGGPNTPLGRLYILDALPTQGQLTLRGTGTPIGKSPAVIDERPQELIFTKPCPDESDNAKIIRLSTRSDRYPLQVCRVTIEGADADRFEIKQGRTGNFRLNPGDSETYKVATTTAPDGRYQAELVCGSNAGLLRIPLTALLGSATLSGLPDSLTLDGEQVLGCGSIMGVGGRNINKMDRVFFIENSGPGGLLICDVRIQDHTDGRWELEGIEGGDVLFVGERRTLVLTYHASTLDVFETATLVFVTSEGTLTVNLKGRVRTSTDDNINLPPEILDLGSSAQEICFGLVDLEKMMFAWDTINDFLLETWRGSQPECCRECLCQEFMELTVQGLAPGSKFELLVEGERSAFLSDPGTIPGFILPIPKDREARIRIEPREDLGSKLHMRMSHWQLSLIKAWHSDRSVLDVSVTGDSIVTLGEGALLGHSLSKDGSIETFAEGRSNWQATSLSSLNKLLVLCGERGLELLSLTDGTFKPIARVEMEPTRFILPIPKDSDLHPLIRNGRCTYLVGNGTMTLLDLTDPGRPREILQVETRVQATTGFTSCTSLMLAGPEGIEVFRLDQKGRPETLGTLKLSGVTSVFGNPEKIFAVDNEGLIHIIGLSKGGLKSLGMVRNLLPNFLPQGRIQVLGNRIIAGRRDSSGFNVYEIQRGRFK